MKKSFTRSIFFLFLLGMVSGLNAQTVFWGDEPGQGDFDGGINDWTSEFVAGADSTWEWISNGAITGGSLDNQDATINSPTASNGAMVFNSDKFSNGPNATSFTPPFTEYTEDLISPTIDLSMVPAGTPLAIELYQVYYWFQVAAGSDYFSSFSISKDDGVTWSEPRDCNPGRQPSFATGYTELNNKITLRVPVSLDLAGESNVRIKFTFAGNFYYWAIDDVKIVDRILNDISIDPGWFSSAPNRQTPLSQAEPFVFMTDVENKGGAEQQNVTLNVSVTDDSGTVVYTESEEYGTLAPDSLDENRIFGSFTPMTLGTHTATYTVTSDSMDQDDSNNTLTFDWEVTEDVFAKELGRNSASGSADSNWDDGIAKSWAYGNHYYVVDGTDILAATAEFVIDNADEAEGIPIYVRLWKWDAPVDEWMNSPDPNNTLYTCAADDRELVGRAQYTILGTEADDEFITVNLIDELTLEDGVELDDNTHYMLMLEMIDTGNDDSNVIRLGANNDFSTRPNVYSSQLAGAPRFGAMIGLNGSGPLADAVYNSTGFGQGTVPCVRMNLGSSMIDNTVDVLEDAKVNVFPTPTSNGITVDIQLSKQYADASIKVVNVTGAIITEKNYAELQNERLTINTSNWANGTYFLQVATAEGVKTRHFVVQH